MIVGREAARQDLVPRVWRGKLRLIEESGWKSQRDGAKKEGQGGGI